MKFFPYKKTRIQLKFQTVEEFEEILRKFLGATQKSLLTTIFQDPAQKFEGYLDKQKGTFTFSRRRGFRTNGVSSFKGEYVASNGMIEVIITASGGFMVAVMYLGVILTLLFSVPEFDWRILPGTLILLATIYLLLCLLPFNYGASEADEEFKHCFFKHILKTEDITPEKYNF